MIALSEIDAVTVLTGARVPLASPDRERRYDWCGDRGFDTPTTLNSKYDRHLLTFDDLQAEGVFLDPADPDVARLLDRRIAERIGSRPAFAMHARLGCEFRNRTPRRWWGIGCEFMGWPWHGRRGEVLGESTALDVPALAEIRCDTTQIPTARAALLRALYPRTT